MKTRNGFGQNNIVHDSLAKLFLRLHLLLGEKKSHTPIWIQKKIRINKQMNDADNMLCKCPASYLKICFDLARLALHGFSDLMILLFFLSSGTNLTFRLGIKSLPNLDRNMYCFVF